MDLAELRNRSVGEQLAAVVAGLPHPERLIDGLIFESVVRRAIFERPPPEVQMLRVQNRIVVPEAVNVAWGELKRDAVQALARAEVLLANDADFFEAAILPRVIGGGMATDLEQTWMAVFRGGLWALTARRQLPRRGYCSVNRREAESLAASGIRHLHIVGTVEQMAAAVVVPAQCEHGVGYLEIPVTRYQALPSDRAWAAIMDLMARA